MLFKKSKLSLIGLTVLAVSILMIFFSKPIVNDIGFRYFATSNFVSASTLNAFTFGVAMLGYLLVGVGACLFLFIGWTSRFRVDHASVHSQVRKVKALFLVACCVLVAVSMVSTQQVNANSMSTTGYYLATPYSPYDWLIGQYSTGLTYAINGSSWANMMTWPTPAPWASLTDNSTAVTEAALAATTSGVVYLKGVAFDLALMNSIPVNVRVVCSYQDESYEYINYADATGNLYQISEGAGLNNGYDIAQDTQKRIIFVDTNSADLLQNVVDLATATKSTYITYSTGDYDFDHLVYINPPDLTNNATVSISIKGSGNAMTTLWLKDNYPDDALFVIGNSVLPSFSDMSLSGNKANQDHAISAFTQNGTLNDGVDCTFYNIWFQRWSGVQIALTRGWDNSISKCQFELSDDYGISLIRYGIEAQFATTMITNNFFSGDGGGIYGGYVANTVSNKTASVSVVGNTFYGCKGNPCIVPGGQSWSITGNTANYVYTFVQLLGDNYYEDITMQGNTVLGFAVRAYKNNATTTPENIKIIGDTYTEISGWNPDIAMEVGNVTDMLISGITIDTGVSSLWYSGITANESSVTGLQIRDSTFKGTFTRDVLTKGTNVLASQIVASGNKGLNDIQVDRLRGILGVADATWDVAPSDLTYVTDGSLATSCVEGNKTVSGTIGSITFDMGASYTVEMKGRFAIWSNASTTINVIVYESDDGTNYHYVQGGAMTTGYANAFGTACVRDSAVFQGTCRYIRLTFTVSTGVVAHIMVYDLQATDQLTS